MNTNAQTNRKIDVIQCLLAQNFYQRLGLRTNSVSVEVIQTAYNKRLRLLADCERELNATEIQTAKRLIDEAYETLHKKSTRWQYDNSLMTPDPVGATVMKGSKVEPNVAAKRNADRRAGTTPPTNWSCRYKLGNKLSEGERAVLWKATDLHLRREVVVKQIRSELFNVDGQVERFQTEAEQFAGFNASNLCKILDFDAASGSIVLERMAADLSQSMTKGTYSHSRIREILRDALNGLASLHAKKIAHGRVEGSHLLVDDQGHIKLAITPGLVEAAPALRPSPCMRHLAPELLNANVFGEPSLAIDVYALGFVILELLLGRKFAQKVNESIENHDPINQGWLLWHASPTDHLPSIKSLVPTLPTDLVEVLDGMTNKQQHARFRDAEECLVALREAELRCDSLEPSVIAADAVDDLPIEILGELPQLHATYQDPSSLTWQDVRKEPAVLLQPRGRSKLAQIGVALLATISFLFLMVTPTPKQPDRAPNREPPIEHFDELSSIDLPLDLNAPEVVDDGIPELPPVPQVDTKVVAVPNPRTAVLFSVHPNGRVLAIDGIVTSSEPNGHWMLAPGDYLIQCHDTAEGQDFETRVRIPPSEQAVEIHLHAPQRIVVTEPAPALPAPGPPSPAPLATFTLEAPSFTWVGTSDPASVVKQQTYFRNVLADLVRFPSMRPKSTFGGKPPRIELPSYPIDPRATFSEALLAYREGDLQIAQELCERSLTEARYFRVPFGLPVVLLTHIEMTQGNIAPAVAHSRQNLQWAIQMQAEAAPGFQELADTLAWWNGIVLGFAEEAKASDTVAHIDLEFSLQQIAQMLSSQQLSRFHAGLESVRLTHRHLLAQLAQHQQAKYPETVSLRPSQPSLPLSLSSSHLTSYGTQWSYSKSKSGSEEPSRSNLQPRSVPAALASPSSFNSYQACDITVLSDLTMATMTEPLVVAP